MDKRKSILNISVSIGFKLLMMIVVIIVKRLLIQFCGNDVNGLNSLYLSIIGFLSVAELGIGSAITFCMYKPIVEGDKKKVAALYHLFHKLYLSVGGIVFTSGLLLMPFVSFFAKDYSQLNVNLYTTFFLILISVVITYGYGAKTSLIIAYKNNYITTTISSVGLLLQYGLQITVLLLTKSFELYLVCRIISALLQGIITDLFTKKNYSGILLDKKQKLDKETKRELFRSIKSMFMHKVGSLLVNTADSMIISIFIGVVSLGHYSNYRTILTSVTGIIALVFTSITSVLGHLYVQSDREISKNYFDFFHFLNFWLGMIFYLGYYAVIDSLISILFSPELVVSKSVSFVIAVNGFVQFMRKSALAFRDATGTFYNDRWKPLIEGAVNIVLSILFVRWIGVTGVIVATIITNLVICHIIEPYVLYKYAFSKSPSSYYKRNYGMVGLFFAAMIIMDFIMQSYENFYAEFFVNGLLSLCISLPICVIVILINWEICGKYIKGFFRRRRA